MMGMTETPSSKLRWYQYRLRSLFLLMIAVSLVCSWLAVRWQRQHEQRIARVVIAFPGASAVTADELAARPYCFDAIPISRERIIAISSRERVEVYFVARGIDPDEFLNQVRAVRVNSLPQGAAIQEITLLDRGASIPKVESTMVDTFQITVNREKTSQLGISISTVFKALSTALSSQDKIQPTQEGVQLLEKCLVEPDFPTGQGKVHLGDVAEIKIVQEPSHVIWQFPDEPSDSVPRHGKGDSAH
jgi:hypothetical protein